MDRKSVLLLLASFVLILLWQPLLHKLYPPKPGDTNSVATATNQLVTNAATLSSNTVVMTTNAAPIPSPTNDTPEELIVITNDLAFYTFTSRGGGLKFVQLRKYPEAIDCMKTLPGEKRLASLNTLAPLPILSLLGTGEETAAFQLSRTGDMIRAERGVSNGVVVVKEFQVFSNYLLTAKVRLENRSAASVLIPAHEVVIGATTPMGPKDDALTMGTFWFNGAKAEHIQPNWFANKSFLSCVGAQSQPRAEFQNGLSNVVWGAVHNQFFSVALMPREAAPKFFARSVPLASVEATAPGTNVVTPLTGIQSSLGYPALTLAANEGLERQYTLYAGPREYNNLARIGDQMKNELDLLMDFGRWFGFFAKILLLSMNGLHAFGISYGLAIILITVIIKALFWPLTAASAKSMKRMQALQPQLKAITDKYQDDPMKKQKKTMELWKEHKISPLGGCLPMVLQIPVFIGFYQMIRSAIELRGAGFLWACDLSQADTVAHIAGFPINPMPIIYGVTMLWSAQLTPVSPGIDPAQQKMMKYMPVFFLLFLYNMAAGLTLYWTVQNLLTILQMKLTKTKTEPAVPAPVVAKKKK